MAFLTLNSKLLTHPPTCHSTYYRNEIIIPFLWGQGDEEPIRYRLLPAEQFCNIREFAKREQCAQCVTALSLSSIPTHLEFNR